MSCWNRLLQLLGQRFGAPGAGFTTKLDLRPCKLNRLSFDLGERDRGGGGGREGGIGREKGGGRRMAIWEVGQRVLEKEKKKEDEKEEEEEEEG